MLDIEKNKEVIPRHFPDYPVMPEKIIDMSTKH